MKAEQGSAQEAPKKMSRRAFAPMPVVALLGLLIAATMLPPLAFSLFLLDRTNRTQQDVVATLAEATAGAAIETVDRQVQGMVTTLRGLSTVNALNEGNLPAYYEAARTALAGTDTFLIVVDKSMRQLLNTRRPYGEALGQASDPGPINLAIDTGAVVVSDGFLGRVAEKWVFNVVLPWKQRGEEPMALMLTQNAEALAPALAMENLRGGWNAAIVDKKGVVLSSTLMSSDVGKPFFLDKPAGPDRQTRATVDFNSRHYELITKESKVTGWRVQLWAERDVIQRPMARTFRLLLLGGVGMLAAAGFAAWLLGRQITKSVRRLAAEAHQFGAGDDVVATTYPVRELNTVSSALADAAAERKASENEIRLLMREVAHRAKNQLTVVSSLAKQSARSARDVADFSESFQQRIMGLARSTDLLIAGSVAGVELGALLRVQIEPFKPAEASKLEINGPEFRLSLQAAQTLGLALHEMATNAAKYGALSTPHGSISATWSVEGENLVIVWRERLTPFEPPSAETKGFGTQLIDRTLGGALGAKIDRIYHQDGLECRIEVPVTKLLPEKKADPAVAPEQLPN
ncbi:MAG: sensor histidine kinase [Rhizobiaceae bacterium]